jgi:hypothetical protein
MLPLNTTPDADDENPTTPAPLPLIVTGTELVVDVVVRLILLALPDVAALLIVRLDPDAALIEPKLQAPFELLRLRVRPTLFAKVSIPVNTRLRLPLVDVMV